MPPGLHGAAAELTALLAASSGGADSSARKAQNGFLLLRHIDFPELCHLAALYMLQSVAGDNEVEPSSADASRRLFAADPRELIIEDEVLRSYLLPRCHSGAKTTGQPPLQQLMLDKLSTTLATPLGVLQSRRAAYDPKHDDSLPHNFFCPITADVMRTAVTLNGRHYERDALAGWLLKNGNDPIEREKKATTADIRRNRALQNEIQLQLEQRSLNEPRRRAVLLLRKALREIRAFALAASLL